MNILTLCLCCVCDMCSIRLIWSRFYNMLLSAKKLYLYFVCYFKFGLRTNQPFYSSSGKAALAVTLAEQ